MVVAAPHLPAHHLPLVDQEVNCKGGAQRRGRGWGWQGGDADRSPPPAGFASMCKSTCVHPNVCAYLCMGWLTGRWI